MSRTFFASRSKNFVNRHFWALLIPNPHLRTITQIARHLAYPLATVSITPLPLPPPLASPFEEHEYMSAARRLLKHSTHDFFLECAFLLHLPSRRVLGHCNRRPE
ncbi:hypothetical protein AZE42_06069 [Rhizopogon vesiculosus]|uniref:Uncharacterized protein n=1 Tax=Rhizopogon vesiculosus TaxID=180088 RepID=A0A1J8QYD5_9AGAM|nr:hypothetical protein AZE42_06069 [Rhizopogon vesiculosus]